MSTKTENPQAALTDDAAAPLVGPGRLRAAIDDLLTGASRWRIWTALALFDIRARYRRSRLGQFWITISMAVTILCLALVYSVIFKIELAIYLPLVAISFIVWFFIAALVNESATVFIEAEGYLRSTPQPKSMYVYRMLARNVVTFAHNLILIPIVMVVFEITPTWNTLLFIPTFLLTLANAVWLALALGTVCARFRDMPQIVASIVQVGFFVSPVMWGRRQLGGEHDYIIDFNPFAIFLELMREPLLGNAPKDSIWLSALAITLFGYAIALPSFGRFRSRIAYYM